MVERRAHLDHVHPDQGEAAQPAEKMKAPCSSAKRDSEALPCGPRIPTWKSCSGAINPSSRA